MFTVTPRVQGLLAYARTQDPEFGAMRSRRRDGVGAASAIADIDALDRGAA
jgi:hypothetical protein